LRLVVLGGTRFLGRAVVASALEQGHEVTLVNRGVTNPELFPEAERLRVDLTGDLAVLHGRSWDAAIDLDPTQLPRFVRRYAEALDVGHFIFVSTISVYAEPSLPLDEGSPLHEPPDPEPDAFDESAYGGLKVGSERAVQETFDGRAAVVRPGLIAGPHDPTDRYTYWPRRLAAGGNALAPGEPEAAVQLIDVRDLGAWLVQLAAGGISGVFNATGPAEPTTLRALLERTATAVGGGARLEWVDDERLLAAGVGPWTELPLWLPGTDHAGMLRADVSRALAAGLRLRSIEETARDTLAWSRQAGEQRPTLARAREAEILAGG